VPAPKSETRKCGQFLVERNCMTKRYRYLSEAQKRSAVARVAGGEAVSTVARSIGVNRNRLYEWCRRYQKGGAQAVRRVGRPRKAESLSARAGAWEDGMDEMSAARRQIAELQRKIGEQQVDLDFFRKALRHIEETRRAQAGPGGAASTKSSKR
ncbi:MAG TPA: transposase, partial [Hyphomicrobiaceae bacterium]|nr:transposase [Hyphomicrobiaceae bacterium]